MNISRGFHHNTIALHNAVGEECRNKEGWAKVTLITTEQKEGRLGTEERSRINSKRIGLCGFNVKEKENQ